MRKMLILVLLLRSMAAFGEDIDDLMRGLAEEMISSQQSLPEAKFRNSLAVLDFQDGSDFAQKNRLGFAFSEILTQELAANKVGLRIIERKHLHEVLEEMELQLSGIAEASANASRFNQLLGAHFIVAGSVFDAGDRILVTVRMIATSDGQIVFGKTLETDKASFVERAQQYTRVTHRLLTGYAFTITDENIINSLFIFYSYDFEFGLSLGIQASAGFSDKTTVKAISMGETYDFADEYLISLKYLGLDFLFSRKISLSNTISLLPFIGPSIISYIDSTQMTEHFPISELWGPYSTNHDPIRSIFFMLGGKAGCSVEYTLDRSLGVFIGTAFQFFPTAEVIKDISAVNINIPDDGEDYFDVAFKDNLALSGYSVFLGISYSY